jgi:hypothetical protein
MEGRMRDFTGDLMREAGHALECQHLRKRAREHVV